MQAKNLATKNRFILITSVRDSAEGLPPAGHVVQSKFKLKFGLFSAFRGNGNASGSSSCEGGAWRIKQSFCNKDENFIKRCRKQMSPAGRERERTPNPEARSQEPESRSQKAGATHWAAKANDNTHFIIFYRIFSTWLTQRAYLCDC